MQTGSKISTLEKTMKLPAGISTFSEIIENGYYYVDKTQFVTRLV